MKHLLVLLVSLMPFFVKCATVEVKTENGRLQLCCNVIFTGKIHTDGCTDEYFGGIINIGDTLRLDLYDRYTFIRGIRSQSIVMSHGYEMFRYAYSQCFDAECTEQDYEVFADTFDCMTDWFDNAVHLAMSDNCNVEIRYCIVKGFFFFTQSACIESYISELFDSLPKSCFNEDYEICVPLAPVSYFKCDYNPFLASDGQGDQILKIERLPKIL